MICKVISWNDYNVFIYIKILTLYVGIESRVSVCVCVCASLCLSVYLQPKRMVRFLRKFPQMIWQILARSLFLWFSKFEIDDVMATLLYFFDAALSRSHFFVRFSWKFMRRYKLPVFAIENRQNGSLTSAYMADRASKK